MPDVTPERFSVPVTVVGSKRSGRDALAQAVLDALSARRLVAAADALAALREAQQ